MRCPACGTYQPAQLERCFLCGENIRPPRSNRPREDEMPTRTARSSRTGSLPDNGRSERSNKPKKQANRLLSTVPTLFGVMVTCLIFLISAGAVVFFLTKPPDDQRLLKQGRQELANGQYAFAVKTLTRATELRPKDSKVFLALARAYVGVDQVDKAWECVSHAQQLGTGVVAEPALASDLANYYRQRGRYDKALDLLRPLAQANVPGKKAELADLDALWGDEALRNGQVDLALRCWEEVRDLREGSRFSEADSRLSTIYQKLADVSAAKNDDTKALAYLSKLNFIAQNAKNYLLAAGIYERADKLDLAIEQVRKARSLDPHNQILSRQLAGLLTRRGKELMDSGNHDAGYAYLQQAKSLDSTSQLPAVTLKNLKVGLESSSHLPRVSGEVWNPTDNTVNSVNIRAELWDKTNEKLLWSKDNRLVDEFVPPLGAKQSKSFEFVASPSVKADGKSEFRVFLDGVLYKAYAIGKAERPKPEPETATAGSGDQLTEKTEPQLERIKPAPAPAPAFTKVEPRTPSLAGNPGSDGNNQSVPETDKIPDTATVTPAPVPAPSRSTSSAEEKTMKDLDF